MKDPNRLDKVYEKIKDIHKQYFPDWRVGQFWMNFLGWLQVDQKRDPFFPEEDELLEYLDKYVSYMYDNK